MVSDDFRTLVLDLLSVVNGREPDADTLTEVDDVIENNELDVDENIPSWLPDMFQAVVQERQVPPTPLTASDGDGGSPTNFLFELQDLLDMEWVEYGEYFLMQFPKIGLEAKVSIEESTYSVRKISV